MAPCCCARGAGSDGGDNNSCGECRTWEEDLYWNRFQSFYFCQILSSLTEFHNQLVIPKKFANNARALLPSKVTLRGPSRASWSAALTKRDDDLFLTDGWGEFVRAYSLQASDILIIKFDGISAFDIQIFDGGNLCEKESAYFVKKCTHENPAENPRKRASTEADIEEHDDGLIHRATKQAREGVVDETPNRSKYSHFYSRSRRKKLLRKAVSSKASPGKRASLNSMENMNIPSGDLGQSSAQTEPTTEPQNTEKNGSVATEAPNQNNAPQNDRSFSTETPPQDTPNINGSNLTEATPQHKPETNERCSSEAPPLRVPSARGRGRPKRLIDSEPSQRIQTKVSSSKVASSFGKTRKLLSAKKAGKSLTPGNTDSSRRTYVPEEGRLALQMAHVQLTEDNFIVVMRATTVCRRYILTFPPAWCRKHLSPISQDVFFRFGDKTFLTRLSYSPQKTAGQICGGWKHVVDANQLKLYDVCLFNIASRKDDGVILDVTVFRAGQQRQRVPVQPSDE